MPKYEFPCLPLRSSIPVTMPRISFKHQWLHIALILLYLTSPYSSPCSTCSCTVFALCTRMLKLVAAKTFTLVQTLGQCDAVVKEHETFTCCTVVDTNEFILSGIFLYYDIAVYRIRENIFRYFVNCPSFRMLRRTNWVKVVDPKEMCRPNAFRSFFYV